MGVLLQAFYFGPGRVHGVPSPLDGDRTIPFWWDHLAAQANIFRRSGFTAVWIPPPLKGASGTFSNGYDEFDDYDLGDKNQKGTVPTRYGNREQLARCIAVMRANGIDVYADLVEAQRDGDDGHFNFEYVNAFDQPAKGRFPKGPLDFHPNVPQDPGVFSDEFSFGRDLAPINGEHRHVFIGLLAAGDWLTRALNVQGFRLDDVKSVSTEFMGPLLNHGALAGQFAVAEFFDTNVGFIQTWMNEVQHRSSAFDFPLRFMLAAMCNNPGAFDMSTLDHAGLTGADPLGSVTFVENHDTDQGEPIVRNKMLAYAYILTAEGYPCVFYRDYSTDQNCFGLKPGIDTLIWIHEHLADGPTQQRWKDAGVFAYERLGSGHLLVGLNKDSVSRSIQVQTGFPPHTQLHDFTGHSGADTTDGNSIATIVIPPNTNGGGYVCYALPQQSGPFPVTTIATTQDYEGASDLDIKPVVENQRNQVCRIFSEDNTTIEAQFFFDSSRWTPTTSIQLELENPAAASVSLKKFDLTVAQGSGFRLHATDRGFHSFFVQGFNTPPENKTPGFRLRVIYTAPKTA
jgi:alpha-amylase